MNEPSDLECLREAALGSEQSRAGRRGVRLIDAALARNLREHRRLERTLPGLSAGTLGTVGRVWPKAVLALRRGVAAELEAKLIAVPRPAAGGKVERIAQLKAMVDGRLGMKIAPISGFVLAVANDERAAGGWVAMIRWWNPSTQRWKWDVHHAEDFREDAGTFRIRVKAARRRAAALAMRGR